jgi:hypothetical protein
MSSSMGSNVSAKYKKESTLLHAPLSRDRAGPGADVHTGRAATALCEGENVAV